MALRLAELKADCFLISSPANVRYLSGFDGSNGLILLTPRETHFFTDPRYAIAASEKVAAKVHVVKGPLTNAAAAIIKRKRLKKIAFESGATLYDAYIPSQSQLPPGCVAQLPEAGKIIEERRMIKSNAEIATIRESVLINSEAYQRVLRRIRPGVREIDIAAEIEFQMKMLGAEKPSFDTIVAAGPRTAHLPQHAHQATGLPVDRGMNYY